MGHRLRAFRLYERSLYGQAARPNDARGEDRIATVRSGAPHRRRTRIFSSRKDPVIPSHDAPFNGIYAATLCPLDAGGRHLHETALARHFDELASVDGIVGLLINGHAGENFMLSRDDKRGGVEIARNGGGERSIIVGGV